MSNREISVRAKTLIDGKALIEDKTRWWGKDVLPCSLSKPSTRLCAMQALYSAAKGNKVLYGRLQAVMDKHSYELFGGRTMHVNDTVGYDAVMQIYDAAIQEELNKVPETV